MRTSDWIVFAIATIFFGGQASADYLYFASDSGIERITTLGTNRQMMIGGLLSSGPSGVAIDDSAGYVYWTESTTSDVHRANLDGTNITTLFDSTFSLRVGDLAISPNNNRTIWTEVNRVASDDLDPLTGTAPTTLEVIGPNAVDIFGNSAYYAAGGNIYTEPLLGGTRSILLSTSGAFYRDVVVTTNHLYAIDSSLNQLIRLNLTGGPGLSVLVSGTQVDLAKGLVIDSNNNRMYWINANTSGGNLFAANLDGSNISSLATLTENANYLALSISAVPEPSSAATVCLAIGLLALARRRTDCRDSKLPESLRIGRTS